jgi:hypothetical protein
VSACNVSPGPGHPFYGTGVACHMAAGHDGAHTWETEPSKARRGLDKLLSTFASREVAFVASDAADQRFLIAAHADDRAGRSLPELPSPWLCVSLVGGDQFAIWKATGAVYRVGPDGAVEDDPILTVKPQSEDLPDISA